MNPVLQNLPALLLGAFAVLSAAPVSFTVDAAPLGSATSPYIYGKNHGISTRTGVATHADSIQRYRDAGFKMLRLNDGNNASKYNWERKMSSHPDWYNNVYDVDWDHSAIEVADRMPGVQAMYALSLLGWAANNKNHNFDDWLYNNSSWWDGTHHNWAGTPPIAAPGETPTAEADPSLYLERRTPEQNVAILSHFFGSEPGQLGLDSTRFRYWNMDNEADIWNSTHDDVMPDTMSAEEFVQLYVEMAQLARARFPGIKLVGPVLTNEWQWYHWHNELVTYEGQQYSMIEFFIKRIGEEQARTGQRLLDVVDLHFYPGYESVADKANILQAHRIWFDTAYVYPKANGHRRAFPGNSKLYIFQRIRDWLNTYLGQDHGVTLGISECGAIDGAKEDASVIAAWYASHLGEFASAGDVEIFTPWSLYPGLFEAAHLFTRYAKPNALPAHNSADHMISIYPSRNAVGDSLTFIIVNRNLTEEQVVNLEVTGFAASGSWAPTFDLAYLNGETFRSASQNAVYPNGVDLSGNSLTLTVPVVSVTAVVLSAQDPGAKPEFSPRSAIPSSSSGVSSAGGSSGVSSSSVAAGSEVVVWEPDLGAQVRQPTGALGGWWYNYSDPLSTISGIEAETIRGQGVLRVDFDGQRDAEQDYNYAGVGFNWVNTPAGQNVRTVDLSDYSEICVEYQSSVGLRAAIAQPDSTDLTRSINTMTDFGILPATTVRSTRCLPWSSFDLAQVDLSRQSAFQLEVGETAQLEIYSIRLIPAQSTLLDKYSPPNNSGFKVVQVGSSLRVEGISKMRKLELWNLQGHVVRVWEGTASEAQLLDIQGIPAGLHVLRAGPYVRPVLLTPNF